MSKKSGGLLGMAKRIVFNDSYETGKRAAAAGLRIFGDSVKLGRRRVTYVFSEEFKRRPCVRFEDYVKQNGLSEAYLKKRSMMFGLARYAAYFVGMVGLMLAILSIPTASPFMLLFYFVQTACSFIVGYMWGLTSYQIDNRRVCSVGDALRDIRSYF